MLSSLAQTVLDLMLNTASQPRSLQKSLKNALLGRARSAAISILKDPCVSYKLAGSRLQVPLSHMLPLIRAQYPNYSANIGRLGAALKRKYPNMTMVDIGANVGDTVAIVREVADFPILCIDGDPFFFSILQKNAEQWRDVFLANSFIGETNSTINARFESAGGTGHMIPDFGSGTMIQTKTLSELLNSFPNFSQPKLIKVDTDGFDTRIIKSETDFLRNGRPVVFFEYDPLLFRSNNDDGFAVFSSLKSAGYRSALFFENTGEFLVRSVLDNNGLLEEMHNFCGSQSVRRYCDIAVFCEEDTDVLEYVRSRELGLSLGKV